MDPIRRARPVTPAVIAAALGAGIVVACAAPDTPGTPPGQRPTPPAAGSSPPGVGARPPDRELTETASAIDSYLKRAYPGHYAGLTFDRSGKSLIIYRRASPDLDTALHQKFPRAPMELRGAPHPARDLDALTQRISGDITYWQKQGISITSITARTDGTAVEVGTRETGKATTELPKRYGTQIPIQITKADPVLPTAPR